MAVLVMAGHERIQQIEIPRLRGSTGAPGEVQFTISCAEQLIARLRDRGIEAEHTDAIYHAGIYSKPWDLFIALHYDSYGANKPRGCRFARGARDFVGAESDRLVDILVQQYPGITGIPLYPGNQATEGMSYYYGFDYPRREVPAVIAECGVGHHPLDRPQLMVGNAANPQIALALADCIAVFLGADRVTIPPAAPHAIGASDYQKMLNRQSVNERLIQLLQGFEPRQPWPVQSEYAEFVKIRQQYFQIVRGERDDFDLGEAKGV